MANETLLTLTEKALARTLHRVRYSRDKNGEATLRLAEAAVMLEGIRVKLASVAPKHVPDLQPEHLNPPDGLVIPQGAPTGGASFS